MLNLKNVKAGDRFIVQATEGRIVEGKAAPQVEVTLRIVEGPHTGEETTTWGSLADGDAQRFTAEMLRTLGWSCNDITAMTGLGSTRAAIQAKESTYEGKTRIRWSVFPLRSRKAALEPTSLKALAATFKSLAASVPPVAVDDSNRAGELPAVSTGNSNGATEVVPTGSPF
jgi:hypothetical protein